MVSYIVIHMEWLVSSSIMSIFVDMTIILAYAFVRKDKDSLWLLYFLEYFYRCATTLSIGFLPSTKWTLDMFKICCDRCSYNIHTEILYNIHVDLLKIYFRLIQCKEILEEKSSSSLNYIFSLEDRLLVRSIIHDYKIYRDCNVWLHNNQKDIHFIPYQIEICKESIELYRKPLLGFLRKFGPLAR